MAFLSTKVSTFFRAYSCYQQEINSLKLLFLQEALNFYEKVPHVPFLKIKQTKKDKIPC